MYLPLFLDHYFPVYSDILFFLIEEIRQWILQIAFSRTSNTAMMQLDKR
jgi:hypothetical protein